MNRVAIFDMDGTLIDTKKDITISINHVRKTNHNLAPLSEDYVVNAINMPVRNLPKMFYNTNIYQDKDRSLFEEHYFKQCTQHPYLYDGIEVLLKKLSSSHVKLNVATNAPTKFAQTMLSHLGVDHLFDTIIGADKAASKPDTKMLDIILQKYKFSCASDNVWMIGDNSKDIQAAKAKDISSIFATWGFSKNGDADFTASHPLEILDIILR